MQRPLPFLLLLLSLLASCAATSNLEERPTWVFDGFLPAEHPMSFQVDDKLIVNVQGVAPTLEQALDECKDRAESEMRAKVMKAAEFSLSVGKGSTEYKATVKQLAGAGADEVLGLMVRRAAWDGFEEESRYAYGLYTIDRQAAAEQLVLTVSDNYDRLKAIEDRLANSPETQDELERLSLEAIECIARLSVIKDLVRNIGGTTNVGWVDDFAELEQRSLDRLILAGKAREATGEEAELRTALNFYEKARASHPSGVLDDSVRRCELRLPCNDCKGLVASANASRQTLLGFDEVIANSSANADLGRTGVEIANTARNYRAVMQHGCAYFTERTVDKEEHRTFVLPLNDLENRSSELVLASGNARIASGSERELEEVCSLYTDFLGVKNSPVIAGQLQDVKRRLPCTECGHGKDCMTCDGSRGAFGPCSDCRGNQVIPATCYTCEGDGQRSCSPCRGDGYIRNKCNPCYGAGQLTCNDCNGYGSTTDSCFSCGGSGYFWTANGSMTCFGCGGTGKTSSQCWGCWGQGQISCSNCGGGGVTERQCGTCDGSQRSGTCGKCDGRRLIDVPCRDCSDGRQFYNCNHCSGRGLCPTCGGRGHRT